ncbi:hypothetical protein C8R46DRAFT_1233024 [Mycena filopes]|nr:hypothetical protein C8R46DRAFT_1233024 [Mycena filopes]
MSPVIRPLRTGRPNGNSSAPKLGLAWLGEFRQRVKELPPEQQEPFKAKARVARARYREVSRRRAQAITEAYLCSILRISP